MNANRKNKSLRLVRFGDILFDQQKRLILLCSSCQRHYITLEAFQTHINKCSAIKNIVSSINELQYEEDKRKTRLINGKQELFIYEPDAVHSNTSADNSIDWEAELEDPRWYTDDNRVQAAKEKPPATNTKENFEKVRTRHQASKELSNDSPIKQSPKQLQRPDQTDAPPVKRMRNSTPKRTILSSQQQPFIKRVSVDPPKAKTNGQDTIVDLCAEEATTETEGSTLKARAEAPPMVCIPVANAAKTGDTQQILNKLRACGVEVKRRNTRETPDSPVDAVAMSKKQQALEIMRKLQSNGIMCTKVNNGRKPKE